jgi:hypothetical protein
MLRHITNMNIRIFPAICASLFLSVSNGVAAPFRQAYPQLTSTAPSSLSPGRVGFHTNARQIAIRSFDAIGIGDSLTPTLGWENLTGNILRFPVPVGFVLQSSRAVASPEWSVIEGSGSIDVNASDPFKFFRLLGQ